MKIAVEGCCHGELDKIYETIAYLEQKDGVKVELLLCCGDFQSVRNKGDMHCMAVPDKYKQMQTFYKYYSGEKKAPILTIFIGGNHEASNYLQELPYGGWVAPNIYYLGYAGVVRFKGVRIAGVSGIFKSHDYRRGHFEFPPYNRDTLRSVYHTRNIDVFKLKQIKMPIDIFLSHDWPRGIHDYGDRPQLLRKKKFLRQDVESNSLGSPASAELLEELQPSYWFSAHLHVKFAAVMQHPPKAGAVARSTRFLSLDKCLPYRDFLQIVDLPDRPSSAQGLEYDPEWLAILKATDSLQNLTPQTWNPPQNNGLHARWDFSASEEAMMAAVGDLGGELAVPDNFSRTVAAYDPSQPGRREAPSCSTNPQTTELCATLGLTDIYALVTQGGADPRRKPADEEEEEEEDAGSAGSGEEPSEYPTDTSGLSASYNPDEITIEDEWEEEEGEEDGKKGEAGGEGGSAGRSADAVVPEGGAGGRPENTCSPLRGLHPNRMVLPDPRSNRSPSLPLSLPPPCHSTPVHARAAAHAPSPDPALSPTPGLSGGEGDGPAVRVPKRTSGESADGAGTGSTPVIKRRNQTIYTAAEDEDGEG